MNWIEILLLTMAVICIIANALMIAKIINDYRRETTYYTTSKAIEELIIYELDLMAEHFRNGGVYVSEKNESNKKNEQ